MAAVEFALILPVMTLLFFGMLEASDLLLVNRKMSTAANSLVDLVSQEDLISKSQVDDAIVGVTRILEPSNTAPLTIKVVSIEKGPNPNDPTLVHWSRDKTGAVPYAAGSNYATLDDDTNLKPGHSMIVVEIEYDYTSGMTGKVFNLPFHFEQLAKRWPRKSTKVQLCDDTAHTMCTS